jgi:hypothetical protein
MLQLLDEILLDDYQAIISLPTTTINPFEIGIIAGWGSRSYNSDVDSPELYKLEVMTINNYECRRSHDRVIHSSQVCTVSDDGCVSMVRYKFLMLFVVNLLRK